MKSGKWIGAIVWLLRIVSIVFLAGSLMSMIGSEQWWIRMWDFPRLQLVAVMFVGAISLFWLDRHSMRWLPVLLAICACWQFYRIFPYTSFADTEVALADANTVSNDKCFSALSFNVLQTNRDYEKAINLLKRENPDILLLLETDQKWLDALEPVLSQYPSRMDQPLDNKYGLAFATHFEMQNASIQDLAEPDTPSIFATLKAGQDFRLIGLHPRPPHPGQDTDERDAELVIAAKHAEEQSLPVLAIGDFNDVAWSDTSSLFKRLGAFLDPRIGRGPYATFPADKTWLGWPLDHIFVTEDFLLQEIRVLEFVGSDHRPIMARMCLAPQKAATVNDEATEADSEDRSDAEEVIDEFQEDLKMEQNK